jgi:hypothetical protein
VIETPCIKVCVLDPASGLCQGCGRSLDEIARWGTMSGEERQSIMGELKGRMAFCAGTDSGRGNRDN